MSYHNDISTDTIDYLVSILPYDEKNIINRVRNMSFSEFFELQNAINLSDAKTIHGLFADLTEQDNPFSASKEPAQPALARSDSGDDDDTKNDINKDLDKQKNTSKYNSAKQKLASITKQLGNMDASMEEDADMARIKKLAGVAETCSGGASGAGGIATAAVPVGGMQSRSNPSVYTSKKKPSKKIKDDKKKK